MILLADLKRAVKQTIGGSCMLRVCREDDCLLVTDAPLRFPERAAQIKNALEAAGWDVRPSGGLWRLDPGQEMWGGIIRSVPREDLPDPAQVSLPLYSLAVRLTRAPAPAERQPKLPLRVLLKAIEAGDADRVLRFFPPFLAARLREKQPMPEAAGWALVWAMNRHIFDGEVYSDAD